MQKAIKSRKYCFNRLIKVHIRSFEPFWIQYQSIGNIHRYNQELWELCATNRDSPPRDLYIMTLVVCTALRQKKNKKKERKNGPTQKSPVCHVLYLGTYVQ